MLHVGLTDYQTEQAWVFRHTIVPALGGEGQENQEFKANFHPETQKPHLYIAGTQCVLGNGGKKGRTDRVSSSTPALGTSFTVRTIGTSVPFPVLPFSPPGALPSRIFYSL